MAEEGNLYKCAACGVACETEASLLDHLRSHGVAPLSCLACWLTFSNSYLFDYHRAANMCVPPEGRCPECPKRPGGCSKCGAGTAKVRKCGQCGKTFRFRRHYDKHVEGHARNNCSFCDTLLTSRKQLSLHLSEKHLVKIREAGHQCTFCDRRFVKRVTLYKHYSQHAAGKFVCLSCGAFLPTQEQLAAHTDKHNREKRWHCEQCGDFFSRRQQYLVHMMGHKKYFCSVCGENFAAKDKLVEHERSKHQLRRVEKRHVCPTCGRCFLRPQELMLHFRIHTGEKPVHCHPCCKSFRTPRAYMKHLGTSQHANQQAVPAPRMFNCDICDKTFGMKAVLEKHKSRVHGQGEMFGCSFCDHKSACKENMKRHLALHTEDRRFVCEQCGAAFHALQALKDHARHVHSQTRHFTCTQCGKSFKSNSGLNRHAASHSELRPHACHCGQAYKRASHLRRHQESAHGVVNKPAKLLRLRRDETGALVTVEERRSSQKQEKSHPVVSQAEKKPEKSDVPLLAIVSSDLCPPVANELGGTLQCGPVLHTMEVPYDMNSFVSHEPLSTFSVAQLEPLLHSGDEAAGSVLLDPASQPLFISSEALMSSSSEASLATELHHSAPLLGLTSDRYSVTNGLTVTDTTEQYSYQAV